MNRQPSIIPMALITFAAILHPSIFVFAQGNLTPPGAPGPTRLLTSVWTPARGVNDNDYQVPFAFTGKLDKLAFKLGPPQMVAADQKAATDADGKMND